MISESIWIVKKSTGQRMADSFKQKYTWDTEYRVQGGAQAPWFLESLAENLNVSVDAVFDSVSGIVQTNKLDQMRQAHVAKYGGERVCTGEHADWFLNEMDRTPHNALLCFCGPRTTSSTAVTTV